MGKPFRDSDIALYGNVEELLNSEDDRVFVPCSKIGAYWLKVCKMWMAFVLKLENEETEKTEKLLVMRDAHNENLENLEAKLQELIESLRTAADKGKLDSIFLEIRLMLEGDEVSFRK